MHHSDSRFPCRLLIEGADAGARQMAVDEVLLESAATERRPTLRFYRWSEPTLSLGYFQSYAQRDTHAPSRDCQVVRRQTGGGAILHDRELTVGLAIPRAHPLADDAGWLVEAVHDSLIRVLTAYGLTAYRRTVSDGNRGARQPFLCFLRRTQGDVLLGDTKVCGSAQRRRRGAVLQHGSLLLARSSFAPELPGIMELTGRPLDAPELAADWGQEIANRLALALSVAELSNSEQEAVARLKREKYGCELWNRRR